LHWFLVLYVLVAVISAAVALIPGLATLVVVLTFGLGLVLLPAPTALIYMTALWPAVLLRRVGLGLICALAVAVAPGMLSRWTADSDSKTVLAADIARKFSSPPRRIEFEQDVRETTGYGDRIERLLNAPCEEMCQTLLLSRQVDEIRVTAIGAGTRAPRGQVSVVYSYQQRSGCPSAFSRGGLALPATEMRATLGECIVASVDAPWSDSARIVVTQGRDWTARASWLHDKRSFTRYEVYASSDTKAVPLARYTHLQTSVLSMPLVYGPIDSYGLQINLGFRRHQVTFNPSDIGLVLRDALGFKTDALPASPVESAINTAHRILDGSGTEPFGPELMAPINRAVEEMKRRQTLSLADTSFLQRLVVDRRVNDHFQVYLLLERWPAAGSGMIEPILERLERPVAESTGHNHSHLAWILVRAPIESLRPFAPRIMLVAALSDEWHYAPLLRLTGRLGVDPTSLLLKRLRGASSHAREGAVIAVCLADEPWRERLLNEIEALLERSVVKRYDGQKELSVALFALGENNPTAAALLARLPEHDAERLRFDAARSGRHDCPRI
jgi:hypothetical protein